MLPKIKTAVYVVDLPLSGKLEYRPILMKEEIAIFSSIQFGKEYDIFSTLKNIVKDCIITPNFNIEKLALHEFFYLIALLRMKSKGEEIELIAECSKCKSEILFSIDLLNCIELTNKNVGKKVVEFNEDLGIEIKCYPLEALLYLDELFKDKNNSTALYNLVASSVNKLIYEKKVYDASESSKEEIIENVLSRLDDKQFEKLNNAIDDLFHVVVKYSYKCQKCGKEEEIKTNNILSFLF